MKRNIVTIVLLVVAAAVVFGAPPSTAIPPKVERPAPTGKRGVSYGFEQDKTPEKDMELLAPGITWFYNWYVIPHADADKAAQQHKVAFYPMAWNEWDYEPFLKEYLARHPECEYLMGFNEPNLTDQANMTPAQAAKSWPKLVKIAKKYNLKVVSPAMNYGTLDKYWVPWVWLDEFFGIDRVDEDTGKTIKNKGFRGVSLADIDAIAIHCYMPDAGAMKWFVSMFKKYNKPIWLTEFCSWENTNSLEWQMAFMSEALTYLELDPDVEKYAWFLPKGSEPETDVPMNKLLTKGNSPQLTPLGRVYVNMSTCDKTKFVPTGQRINASDITDCHLSEYINTDNWPRKEQGFTEGSSVHFRPGTDSGGAPLDLFDFTAKKWVEYQVEAPNAKNYTLTLRNKAPQATRIQISVDGTVATTISLRQSNSWANSEFPLQLSAGKHKIRLLVTEGQCELNWLRIE